MKGIKTSLILRYVKYKYKHIRMCLFVMLMIVQFLFLLADIHEVVLEFQNLPPFLNILSNANTLIIHQHHHHNHKCYIYVKVLLIRLVAGSDGRLF